MKIGSSLTCILDVVCVHGDIYFQYLSRCVVGASLEEPEEEDDARSTASSVVQFNKEGCYEVVGTLKDKEAAKPEFVREVIQVCIIFIQILFW